MPTTTNYGWTTPADTDLVKDGAAAIRTLGNSVDTTTKNLNPETTLGDIAYRSSTANTNTRLPIGTSGQVLTVAAGVPSWATPTDQTPLTTKGDLFTFSTVDARLGVGANGTVLTADSAEATGLKWAAAASGATTVGVSVYNSTTQTVANNTTTYLAFNSENFDTDGFHSTSTNNSRLTVPTGKGGYYFIYANMRWQDDSATGRAENWFEINRTTELGNISIPVMAVQAAQFTQFTVQNLSAGDYVECVGFQNSGGNRLIGQGATRRFGMIRIGD